jgi:aerobic carbon-monoxide dehydrogenase medium subunit
MKPPPFTYHDPRTVPDALGLLATLDNAKVLAGGQSLMPMLNMRFVLPDHVIDMNEIPGLSAIELRGNDLFIGAMTRQRDLEFSPVVKENCPLLHEALTHVGHRQTRNRGTFGGSLCHLDPSAEQPTVAMAMDATIIVESSKGKREIPMSAFPVSFMTTALAADELMVGARVPLWPKGHGYAFVEFARRHGDFAMAGSAILMTVNATGKIERASVTLCGVGSGPVRLKKAEQLLVGSSGGQEVFAAAAQAAGEIEAQGDVHASPEYRSHLARVLTERALVIAFNRATVKH